MEPKNGGLEDDVPFQLGDFFGSMLIFRGVTAGNLKIPPKKEKEKKSTNYQFWGFHPYPLVFADVKILKDFPDFSLCMKFGLVIS